MLSSREAAPEKFANRTVNKLKYAFWGATSSLKGLAEVVKLYCDGAEVAPLGKDNVHVSSVPRLSSPRTFKR